jgi:DNA-binding CsgD family transcriptional regulator
MTLRKSIILYAVAMAALMGVLKFLEYRFFVRELSIETYVGLLAILFIGLGIWVGRRLTRIRIVVPPSDFSLNEGEMKRLGISKREYEVLELISAGLSNQEIADRLFVSTSTIKTHVSNLLAKLDASRRTQAISRAKELRLIP